MPEPRQMPAEAVLHNFRQMVLQALDRACRAMFDHVELPAQPGATKAEAEALTPVIDAQARRLAKRYGVELVEEEGE